MSVLVQERLDSVAPTRRRLRSSVPAWAKLSLVIFCVVELTLVLTLRAASGLAHVRTLQDLRSDASAGSASAACAEGLAAADDFWPWVPLLRIARTLPGATAHAWGQLPDVVDVAREMCPAIQVYAAIAPSLDRSLADGAGADLLADVRHEQAQLLAANLQLTEAWQQLAAIDATALSGDPRLAQIGRFITVAREQQADISDGLAVLAPGPLQSLLGGGAPRSIVLAAPGGQAFVVLDQGTPVAIGLDAPAVTPVAIITVDDTGLGALRSALVDTDVPAGAPDDITAEVLLSQLVQQPLSASAKVAWALKSSADEHHAWLWVDDAQQRELIARRGWVRQ